MVVSVFPEGFGCVSSLPWVILQQLISLPGVERRNSAETGQDCEVQKWCCQQISGQTSKGVLGRSMATACLETHLSERCNRGRTRFSMQEDKSSSDVFPEMPLLSPAGKQKVRQTRLSLSSWECGVGAKCSDLLNCRNTKQRELVWREKT